MKNRRKSIFIAGCVLLASTLAAGACATAPDTASNGRIYTSATSGVCEANCFEVVREGQVTLLRAKGANGQTIKVKVLHIPPEAQYQGASSGSNISTNATTFNGVTTADGSVPPGGSVATTTQTWYNPNTGVLIVVTTTVITDANGNVIDVIVNESHIQTGQGKVK